MKKRKILRSSDRDLCSITGIEEDRAPHCVQCVETRNMESGKQININFHGQSITSAIHPVARVTLNFIASEHSF